MKIPLKEVTDILPGDVIIMKGTNIFNVYLMKNKDRCAFIFCSSPKGSYSAFSYDKFFNLENFQFLELKSDNAFSFFLYRGSK